MAYAPTPRTTARRLPARARYDRETVHAILDEALVCHLGFVHDGHPFVVPTTFVRVGESLYVHGAAASRTLRAVGGGLPACVTVTLVDGLVMARSAFHHSMNYRSVVVLGTAREVTDADAKRAALRQLVEKLSPGRWALVRPPSDKELNATSVVEMPLDEVSAKVRTGPPIDDEGDLAIPAWAGVIPLGLATKSAISENEGFALPALPAALDG